MKTLWAIPAFLAATVMATASPCGTVYFPQQTYGLSSYVQQQKVYQDPYVQKKVVVLEYAFIPTYPIGAAVDYAPATYAPAATAPQASTAPSPCDAKIAALTATVEELRKQVAGSTTSTPGVPPPGTLPATSPPEIPKKSVIMNECAACHDKAVSANKAKSITLSDGAKVIQTDAAMVGKMLKYVSSGKCPPGKSLEPERFTAFLQELVDLNSK